MPWEGKGDKDTAGKGRKGSRTGKKEEPAHSAAQGKPQQAQDSPVGGLSLHRCPEPGHTGYTLAAFISQCLDVGSSVDGP